MNQDNPDARLLASLAQQVDDGFCALLTDVPVAAMVDFPDHGNVGDSAIYLGELASIRRVWTGHFRYICSFSSYDRGTLVSRLPEGPILIHGGGNVGDIYPHHHEFREHILAEWPGRRVVQLPQTIHFASVARDDQFARAIEKHGNFHLIVRDHRSLEHARARYACEVSLAPDSAFALGHLTSDVPPDVGVLALCRTDAERRGPAIDERMPGREVLAADWPAEGSAQALSANRLLARIGTFSSRHGARDAIGLTSRAFAALAARRVQRGLDLLARGRVVATDRLHAFILASLMGKPNVIADNSYGKLSAVYETWLSGSTLGRWAPTLAAAIDEAERLANG